MDRRLRSQWIPPWQIPQRCCRLSYRAKCERERWAQAVVSRTASAIFSSEYG